MDRPTVVDKAKVALGLKESAPESEDSGFESYEDVMEAQEECDHDYESLSDSTHFRFDYDEGVSFPRSLVATLKERETMICPKCSQVETEETDLARGRVALSETEWLVEEGGR